jgi:hypothetical protein
VPKINYYKKRTEVSVAIIRFFCFYLKFLGEIFSNANLPNQSSITDLYLIININFKVDAEAEKLKTIREIWDANEGVIIMQCFHGMADREALVRESSIITALGRAMIFDEYLPIDPQKYKFSFLFFKGMDNLSNQISSVTKYQQWEEKEKRAALGTELLVKLFFFLAKSFGRFRPFTRVDTATMIRDVERRTSAAASTLRNCSSSSDRRIFFCQTFPPPAGWLGGPPREAAAGRQAETVPSPVCGQLLLIEYVPNCLANVLLEVASGIQHSPCNMMKDI